MNNYVYKFICLCGKVNSFVRKHHIQKAIWLCQSFFGFFVVCSSAFWTTLYDIPGLGSVESAISKIKQYPTAIQSSPCMGSRLWHYGINFLACNIDCTLTADTTVTLPDWALYRTEMGDGNQL
jgi:hypothetical protein